MFITGGAEMAETSFGKQLKLLQRRLGGGQQSSGMGGESLPEAEIAVGQQEITRSPVFPEPDTVAPAAVIPAAADEVIAQSKTTPKASIQKLFFDLRNTAQRKTEETGRSDIVLAFDKTTGELIAHPADGAAAADPGEGTAAGEEAAAAVKAGKNKAGAKEAEASANTGASANTDASASAGAASAEASANEAVVANEAALPQKNPAAGKPSRKNAASAQRVSEKASAGANIGPDAEPQAAGRPAEDPREAKAPGIEQRQAELLSHMVGKLGERLVKFILAVPDEDPLPKTFTKKQERASVRLLNMIVEGNDFSPDLELSVSVLSGYVKVLKTSIINSYRMYCGGDVPQVPRGDDRVVQSLRRLARDLWPLLLLPPDGASTFPKTFQHRGCPIPIAMHPSVQAARNALAHDAVIARLFPKKIVEELPNASAQKSPVSMEGIGTLGVLYLDGVILSCIRNACYRAMLLHGGADHDLIMKYVEQSVADLRTLINEGSVEMPVVIGLRGVSLPPDALIDLDKGILRAPHDAELEYFFDGRDKPTAIYQTAYKRAFFSAGKDEMDDRMYRETMENVADFSDFISGASEEVNNVRFSILMTSKSEPAQPYAVCETAILMLEPTLGTPAYYSFQNTLLGECRSAKADVKGIETWHKRIVKKHNNSLEIAKRRLLAAASPGRASEDALVEALLVWENLFGASTKNIQRITSSIAELLGSNADAKADLQKKLHHIYNQRNKIVYGTSNLSTEKIKALGDDAVQYAIRAMQVLYMKKTGLLSLSAEERSQSK
jgi:hypothetical protein